MRLIDFFDASTAKSPKKIAFVQPDSHRITYAEAKAQSEQIAAAIDASVLAEDAKCAVFSPNDALAFIAMLAIFRAGRVWVPLNARNTIEDNAAFMASTRVECLFFHSKFEAEALKLHESSPGLGLLVCLDGETDVGLSLSEFAASGRSLPDIAEDPQRVCNILATGGTTGRSKGTVWTNQTWETLIATFWSSVPRSQAPTVHLCAAPMTHGAGILALMLMPAAATNVLLAKPDAAAVLKAIEEHKVTHMYLPPTVLYSMLAHPDLKKTDLSSLTCFVITAAPVAQEKLKEAIEAFGPVICQTYGQSEAPMMLTYLSPDDHMKGMDDADSRLLRSCGKPTMFSRVEIMDENGAILPTGETGEIVARSNLVMLGYYDNPEATAEVSRFGWHHTGDVGYKNDEGYVFIVDRMKDMIITGGFNVYTTEVEQAVLAHPAVQDCAVFGVPDEKWGEAVKAVVELKPGADATPEAIIAFLRPILGGVKTPKTVEVWDDLPRSPVGKVLKRKIRDKYWQGQTRAV
ncbi:MAG: AMP-binding protein [Novosphingobium sp.]|uniref:class I adenylate-forming enzyme family protein n=1 Tax=Sulfitobacter sp. MOLA879 TaxID=3368579 RepID=UPI00357BB5FE